MSLRRGGFVGAARFFNLPTQDGKRVPNNLKNGTWVVVAFTQNAGEEFRQGKRDLEGRLLAASQGGRLDTFKAFHEGDESG